MSRLTWGDPGTRFYEAGVDRGVLYLNGIPGVPWSGLTSVSENPTGGAAKPFYIDGVKYSNTSSPEEFEATLTAFTYPDEFSVCDGTAQVRSGMFLAQQRRKPFGLSYRTMIGSDVSDEHAYKLHLVYNALAAPSVHNHKTIVELISPDDFSWKITTLPPATTGYQRSSHIMFDSRIIDPLLLSSIEDILYGNDSTASRLPSLAELTDLVDTGAAITVVDNGDGTFTITAPMFALQMLDQDTFQLSSPNAVIVDDNTYTLSY